MKCVSENEIEIAVIDAVFPDGNSVTIIPELKKIKPELKVLVFSGLEEEDYALKFFNAGANGFLTKVSEEEEIKNALLKIYHEGRYISTVSQGLMMASLQVSPKQNLLSKLTEREIQIVKMYVQGYGNLEIANQLDIKQNTVSTIKKRVFEKLDIDNLVDLADLLKSL